MEVEYRLDVSDYVAFDRSTQTKWDLWVARLLPVLIGVPTLAVGLYGLSFGEEPNFALAVLVWISLSVFGCTVVLTPYVWLVYWTNKKRLQKKIDQLLAKGDFRMTLASDGMYSVMGDTQSFIRWSGISRVKDTPTHAFIYSALGEVFILPARAFATEQEFRNFVALARTYQKQVSDPPPTMTTDAITRTTDITS